MDMEILKDDSKKKKTKDNKSSFSIKINPLFIHILILIIILVSIFFYFSSSINFDFNKDSKMITIVGDIKNFDEVYNGTLNIFSKKFILTTSSGVYNETSKNLIIKNFNGEIKVVKGSMIFFGNAKEIFFGSNLINLNGGNFTLVSEKKTNVDLLIDDLLLNFEDGRIKISDDLNYDFENSSIHLMNFNFSLNYDSIYVLSGYADKMSLTSTKNNIVIGYVADKKNEVLEDINDINNNYSKSLVK